MTGRPGTRLTTIPGEGFALPQGISRREILKLASAGLIAALIQGSPQIAYAEAIPEDHGRVLDESVSLHASPSFKSRSLASYFRDTVVPIQQANLGDNEPSYNRTWYFTGDGYLHSGSIQPVGVSLNPVKTDLPPAGALAEVTVPFTDARWKPGRTNNVAYRLYYETTHWVVGLHYDREGNPWYEIAEDKWKLDYYVPAAHVRIIPYEELVPLSIDLPSIAKRIEVLTAQQVVVAYEIDKPVFVAKTATGAQFSNGNFATPPGRHVTAHKRPSRHMAAGNLAFNGYDLPGVPWISYITKSGIAFHGTYWHNNFGRPRSHGCINLTSKAARWVYRWTLPIVPPREQLAIEETGTIVDVY